MHYSLCLQATAKYLEIALCDKDSIIQSMQIVNHTASSLLIPTLDQLLKNNNLSLKDCLYIAANQGPAPFTTLRTVLATINGIQCATSIPLIGVDGLKGLLAAHTSKNYVYMIALLNAFNNELYYAIPTKETVITGYATPENVIPLIQTMTNNQSTLLIGNGIALLEQYDKTFIDNVTISSNPSVEHLTLTECAQQAWSAWCNKRYSTTPLMPLYLKKHAAERV